jgi:hypothetical protein
VSKLKIKLKLTGFELEIEGSRDDVPQIQQAISRQLGGMLQPGVGLLGHEAENDTPCADDAPMIAAPVNLVASATKRKRKPQVAGVARSAVATVEEPPVNWPRDAFKYGTPSQSWKTAEKAMWTLYVTQEAAGENELTSKRICDTFNKHYRQAKPIMVGNVNRDLGTLKVKAPSLVGEDTTKSPAEWYLTDEGSKEVQRRILAAQAPKE